MADYHEVHLTPLKDVAWQRVAFIQVKGYDVTRRIEIQGGPIKSLPLLGSVRRFAVELVHKDDTWDRVDWLDSSAEAHRLANEIATAFGLIVRVVP